MCVFRELNAIGTWTNYAKQMAERFLNAERERELGTLENSILSQSRVKKFRIFCYLWDSKLCRENKKKEKKGNLRE